MSSSAVIETSPLVPEAHARRIVDPRSYGQHALLHESFSWLRKHQPLGKVVLDDYAPFWLVTKHADIQEISRQNDKFHNGDLSTILIAKGVDENIRRMTGGSPHMVRNLVNMDPPEHMKYRMLTQSWFSPNSVRRYEEKLRGIARGFVDRMVAGGERCDFVRDVALHYPLHVLMEILGVPEKDEPLMLKLTQELFGARDPDMGRSAAEMEDPAKAVKVLQQVLADFGNYFNGITEARRREPRDDVATVIANATIDGAPIKPFEAASYYVILATAGHDTTSASTAGAIWELCNNPEQLAKVQADPSLIAGLVDEAIRWTTPVKHFMRSAVVDYELRGSSIKAGDWLMLSYYSGNFDEEVYPDPYSFRVDRTSNRHLAFGFGAHACLGQHMAKLEMRVLLEELLPRIASLELDGTPKTGQSPLVSGPKTLPIRCRFK
ncbi:MAG: cytochrome [Hydrocarboniphaga sp.]|uniref:cytochrome P450 n=1 Tax=Hydrocarboniphaga sp. TaxID=2033016 RepID=UPI00261E13FF|nr:cytochrome P450 [Hydrocarboniphaga sp.]MDB5969944.1 cytochrome [Hydrocarboniphaga sp.]